MALSQVLSCTAAYLVPNDAGSDEVPSTSANILGNS